MLGVSIYFGTEHIAYLMGWAWGATSYVMAGAEAAMLWCAVAAWAARRPSFALAAAPAVLAAFEASLRAACRLSLPMDRIPVLGRGQTLCEAAWGSQMAWVSVAAAVLVAAAVSSPRGVGSGG